MGEAHCAPAAVSRASHSTEHTHPPRQLPCSTAAHVHAQVWLLGAFDTISLEAEVTVYALLDLFVKLLLGVFCMAFVAGDAKQQGAELVLELDGVERELVRLEAARTAKQHFM